MKKLWIRWLMFYYDRPAHPIIHLWKKVICFIRDHLWEMRVNNVGRYDRLQCRRCDQSDKLANGRSFQ